VSALALFDELWKHSRAHLHLQIDLNCKQALEHIHRSAGQYRRYLRRSLP
jgi:hypothetical protein